MKCEQIIDVLRANRRPLAAAGVAHAYLFGSVTRRKPSPNDIDIMIDVAQEPFSMFDIMRVEEMMEDLLSSPVDVVVRADALKPGKKLNHAAREEVVNVF